MTAVVERARRATSADAPTHEEGFEARPAFFVQPWLRVVAGYAASRAVVLAAGFAAAAFHYHRASLTLKVFAQWDGMWYLNVVRHGYPASVPSVQGWDGRSVHAFFPLYPLIVRGAMAITPLGALGAALLVSWLVGALACVAVWLVAREVVGPDRAVRAAVAFAFFPGAFILSMVYAESVTIAFAALSVYGLLRRRWWLAGVAAALATAARPNALALVPACMLAAYLAWRRHGDRRGIIAVCLAPVGTLAYFAFLWARTGSPMTWMTVERNGWGQTTGLGIDTFRNLATFLRGPFADPLAAIVVVGLAVTIVLARALWKSKPSPVVGVYTATVLFLCYSASTFSGRPRFVLAAFPLVFPLARLRRLPYVVVMGASAIGLFFLTWTATTVFWFPP